MKKPSILIPTFITALFLLSGCSALIPYEEDFACTRPDNMGKCVDTESAYLEIMSGESNVPYAKPASTLKNGESNQAAQYNSLTNADITPQQRNYASSIGSDSGYQQYLDANYKETAALLNADITPVLSSGDTIKIVLLPNSITSKMLISERTMYVILKEPEFLMGDYLLKKSTPVIDIFGE